MNNTTDNPILSINDLCFQAGKKKILDHIDIRFKRGETVLIAGINGAGKSSLLRCIAGVYLPDSGNITFDKNVSKKKIGFISDKMSLFENYTLEEGIRFHCRVYGIENFDDSLLKRLNIKMTQKIKDLSNGERAIYHLSLLISQKPEILLIDEIIHIIDPYLRELFLESLIELIEEYNTTIIMINHTFSEMGRLPERVMIMETGSFILDEKVEALTDKVKKIVTDKELDGSFPVLFEKRSPVYNEYYIYPYKKGMESKSNFEFQDIELSEIIKSFIGGYYAKKRN